jgi:DNA-binding NarL/FixJ family response regulator
MQYANVVLLQSDPNIAQTLAGLLANTFCSVHVAGSVEELRHAAAKYRPSTIVIDLESASLTEVELLKKEFDGVRVICNHRVADEEMWTRTLNVGADDCCPSSDTRAILSAAAAVRNQQAQRHVAA